MEAAWWTKDKNESVGPHYFVHYKGWKQTCVLRPTPRLSRSLPKLIPLPSSLPPPKLATDDDLTPVRWDEWVPEERLKKLTDENILQQKKLVQAQRARDQLEREALAKAEAAEASRQKASGGAPAAGGSGAVPAVAGRREEKRGQKRGRDGEGVSARTVGTGGGEEC